jgi:hypothetical protein
MQYAQLNEDGTYLKQCEDGLILWDANNYCTAEALYKDGKADMFRVVPLQDVAPPDYDPMTQEVSRDGGELVDGQWQYRWKITALSPEQIAAKNESIMREVQEQTQQRLDEFAQTRNYDGVLSLCTYASSANTKFRQEGQYGVEARDATWSKLYEILAEVQEGTRPVPSSYADIENELPALVWPV